MGTIVVSARHLDGLVCRDPCGERDWKVARGFSFETLMQASHRCGQEGLETMRSPVKTGAKCIPNPSALPYEWDFGALLAALTRSGFIRDGHEVGQASVVLDNFRIPSLKTLLVDEALAKLVMFWHIFFETL